MELRSRIDEVLKQCGDLRGKVIVSCSLPLNAANTELALGYTTSPALETAAAARPAHSAKPPASMANDG